MSTLEEAVRRLSREGELYEKTPDGSAHCRACGHECRIPEGKTGICRVRFNRQGKLMVPDGYVCGLQADPIEKKPFFHVLPGQRALSFGMLGCNFSCRFCQNWLSSQALKDPQAGAGIREIAPEAIAALAGESNCRVIASTYNEPLVSSEWAVKVFRAGRPAGLRGAFVSNGHATRQALEYLRPWVDLYKVDLKCFDENKYLRMTGGKMSRILATIEDLLDLGFWVEAVTLVIPGWNDSDLELGAIAKFLAGISTDIPWHVTAYHPDYLAQDFPPTPPETLRRACAIGRAAGLRFVYAGNATGRLPDLEDTFCPSCAARLIERSGFTVLANRLADGRCPKCATKIPGVWK